MGAAYKGPYSPLNGLFLMVNGRDPVVLQVDGMLCVPVFTGPDAIVHAEKAFALGQPTIRQITDGAHFYQVYHHTFRVIIDPRIVDGQSRYDEVVLEPDPKEVS